MFTKFGRFLHIAYGLINVECRLFHDLVNLGVHCIFHWTDDIILPYCGAGGQRRYLMG
jgi:hypothetical protein